MACTRDGEGGEDQNRGNGEHHPHTACDMALAGTSL